MTDLGATEDESTLDCRIYADVGCERAKFVSVIACLVKGEIRGHLQNTIECPACTIDILNSDDFDCQRRKKFPDGFLFFRYFIEIYPRPRFDQTARIQTVSTILQHLWKHGYSAVAACDYEQMLPEQGGYKSQRVPWPATEEGPIAH